MKPLTTQTLLRHVAFITHAVPADRVRRHLPRQFELETFTSELPLAHSRSHSKELAFVTATCFKNKNFHWSMLRYPKLTFYQATFRTYVRFKGRPGVFVFGNFLGTRAAFALERSLARDSMQASFQVKGKREYTGGYRKYDCQMESPGANMHFSLRATRGPESVTALKPFEPFLTGADLAQHLTYRLHGFFRSSLGYHADQVVEHRRMRPSFGELFDGRFEFWEKLGILDEHEARHPFIVLVEPAIRFTAYVPVPIRFLGAHAAPESGVEPEAAA